MEHLQYTIHWGMQVILFSACYTVILAVLSHTESGAKTACTALILGSTTVALHFGERPITWIMYNVMSRRWV